MPVDLRELALPAWELTRAVVRKRAGCYVSVSGWARSGMSHNPEPVFLQVRQGQKPAGSSLKS